MPPPEKFRSGHLSCASEPLRRSASSVSYMDESLDAEVVEVFRARYSIDSLPRRTTVPLYRYANLPG